MCEAKDKVDVERVVKEDGEGVEDVVGSEE